MKDVLLSDFCDTGSGGTPSRARMTDFYDNGTIPWVKSGELSSGEIFETEEHITAAALKESAAKLVKPGALLMAMYGATVGQVAKLGVAAATNQAVCYIVPDQKLCNIDYLNHFLRTIRNELLSQRVGGGQPNISQGIIKSIRVPLPPLAEQKRIGAILDKADAIRRKLQQSLRLSDEFLRSVFLDMFGDPEGQGWENTTVEELASEKKGSIRTGPFGSQLLHSEFVDEGIAVLGIDNAVRNRFAWGQQRFITQEKYEDLKRYTVHPGYVLITIMGTCGRCAVVPQDIPKAINTKHLCCITLDPKKCLPEFLHSYFLIHPMAKSYLGQAAKGAIMDGLNGGLIKSLRVPKVPIALQRKYAQLVKNRTKVADRITTQTAEAETLFSSLQQRAFRGGL